MKGHIVKVTGSIVLCGWYLLVPPVEPHNGWVFNLDAPLSRWNPSVAVGSTYDTAQACQAAAVDLAMLADLTLRSGVNDPGIVASRHGRCVVGDDPRLRP